MTSSMEELSVQDGHPIEIVKINEDDHTFFLDEEALNGVLQDERIKDKPLCIVSVAGEELGLCRHTIWRVLSNTSDNSCSFFPPCFVP